jgi:hypothetical protein
MQCSNTIENNNGWDGRKVESGMNRAGGVMQVLETASEHLMLFFSCTAKCAVKKRDKTSGYIHSFTSQAEQFARTLRSKNRSRIFDVETGMFRIRKALPKNRREIVCL